MRHSIAYLKLLPLLFSLGMLSNSFAATFIVNVAEDDSGAHDINPGDGICSDSYGACTLRAALEEANATVTADEIRFHSGFANVVLMIAVSEGPLPDITNTVSILGTSINAYNNSATLLRNAPPQFTIDGSQLSSLNHRGLSFWGSSASDSVVSGLSIVNFPGIGLFVGDGANNLRIDRNYIGVRPDRTAAGNGWDGIRINSSSNTTIGKSLDGGKFEGLGNVIANNGYDGIVLNSADDTKVLGNLIGISPSGTGNQGNDFYGIKVFSNNCQIGDANSGSAAGNFLAGNDLGGIFIKGYNNRVVANSLGKGETGGFISSAGDGIKVIGYNNQIGGLGNQANKINEHLGSAMKIGDYGLSPDTDQSNSNSIIGNLIGSSGQFSSILRSGNWRGINVDNGSFNLIHDNQVINSTDIGIRIRGNANNILRNVAGYVKTLNGSPGAEPNQSGLNLYGNDNIVGTEGNGNYLGGNLGFGAYISGNNQFEHNMVGVDSDFSPIGNGSIGVYGYENSTTYKYNVIGANSGGGLTILGGTNIQISGNYIGVAPDNSAIGNQGHGIAIVADSIRRAENILISDNNIAYSSGYGIGISATFVLRASWLRNVMHHNVYGGADIGFNGHTPNDPGDADESSNRQLNYPEIDFVRFIASDEGDILTIKFRALTPTSAATYPLYVDLYWSDLNEPAQGRTFLSSATYPSPSVPFTYHIYLPAWVTEGTVTAVVRDSDGNSSEFAPAIMFVEQSDILFSDSLENE